jgi:hypothetical protein
MCMIAAIGPAAFAARISATERQTLIVPVRYIHILWPAIASATGAACSTPISPGIGTS